ncbi:hypothetical protein PtA15_10A617 [Puccinia triticina]|nr:uncharacterized protein PtA15_10A617 [Puccinia triticina]WAQ89193.1 hypothetical protein PtA15_10A617 [Puccinia triticina]
MAAISTSKPNNKFPAHSARGPTTLKLRLSQLVPDTSSNKLKDPAEIPNSHLEGATQKRRSKRFAKN